jgi:hypothetical protein
MGGRQDSTGTSPLPHPQNPFARPAVFAVEGLLCRPYVVSLVSAQGILQTNLKRRLTKRTIFLVPRLNLPIFEALKPTLWPPRDERLSPQPFAHKSIYVCLYTDFLAASLGEVTRRGLRIIWVYVGSWIWTL